MLTKTFISILLSCFFTQTFSQVSVIGKWRPINPKLKINDTTNKQLKYGDIEIRQDSTFHIEGDSSTQNSSIPGWHTGDESNGTCEVYDNNHLTLWLEPKENKMFLSYIIIKLTKDKLILRSSFNKNKKKYDIKYLRL